MSSRPPRIYTVEEANQALPKVREAVGAIVQLASLLPELEEQARIDDYKTSRRADDPEAEAEFQKSRRAIWDAEMEVAKAVARLEQMGIALKDPSQGLIDFYAYRDDEMVELCWQLGEESVAHWHRIGEGFAGRKRL